MAPEKEMALEKALHNTTSHLNTKKLKEQVESLKEVQKEQYLDILSMYVIFWFMVNYYNKANGLNLSIDEFKNELIKKENLEIEQIFIDILNKNLNYNLVDFIKWIKVIIKENRFKKILQNTNNNYSEAFKIYDSIYNISFKLQNKNLEILNVDNQLKTALYPESLENPDFKKYIDDIEIIYWEKIDCGLDWFLQMFNESWNIHGSILQDPKKSNLLKWIALIKQNFWDYNISLIEKINLVDNNIVWDALSSEFETILKLKWALLTNFSTFWLSFPKTNFNSNIYRFINSKVLNSDIEALNKKLNENIYLAEIFNQFYSNKDLSFTIINDNMGYLNKENKKVLNNLWINRFIESNIWYWINLLWLFDEFNYQIKNAIDEKKVENKENFIEWFTDFLSKIWTKAKNIDEMYLLLKNYITYIRLWEKEKQDFLNNWLKNIQELKELFPKTWVLISDNVENAMQNKEKIYLKNIFSEIKNIDIDYIPNETEKQNLEQAKNIWLFLKNDWGIDEIRLSDVFLIINTKKVEFFMNNRNSTNFKNLKSKYLLNWIWEKFKTSDLLIFDCKTNDEDSKINYNKQISFYIEELLENNNYTFLINNYNTIKNKILLNKWYHNIEILAWVLRITNKKLYLPSIENEKLSKNLWLSDEDKINLFWLNIDEIKYNSKWIDLYRYYLIHSKYKNYLNNINYVFLEVKKVIDINNIKFNQLDLLWFLTDIHSWHLPEYWNSLEEIVKNIPILKTLEIKFKNSDEIKFYLRTLKNNQDFLDIAKEKDFEIFFDNLSKEYYWWNKEVYTLNYAIEIYKHLKTDEKIKSDVLAWDFTKIDEVMKFMKQKFAINTNHPFFINSAVRLIENFEWTKNLIQKLEWLWENVNSNKIAIVCLVWKIISKEPGKNNFFFDKIKLIDNIKTNIYNKEKYERLKEWNREKPSLYTERPNLENMTILELWYIYIFNEWMQNTFSWDNENKLSNLILKDYFDKTTEVWWFFYLEYSAWKIIFKNNIDTSLSTNDNSHESSWKSNFFPWIHYHFHAFLIDNKEAVWPSWYWFKWWGDFTVSNIYWAPLSLITPIKLNNWNLEINYDLYWVKKGFDENKVDYSKYSVVDMWSIKLKRH